MVKEHAASYVRKIQDMLTNLDLKEVERLTNTVLDAYKNDKQIFIIGNGGSASAASHMACDWGKGTVVPGKRRMRVISLTDNMAMFSAIANDFGYENVFVEQLKNILNPGDLVVGISASGNSPNVVNALRYANQAGGITASIVGFTGGAMKKESDIVIFLKNSEYGPVEDGHLILNHIVATYLQSRFNVDHQIETRDREEKQRQEEERRVSLRSEGGQLIREERGGPQ